MLWRVHCFISLTEILRDSCKQGSPQVSIHDVLETFSIPGLTIDGYEIQRKASRDSALTTHIRIIEIQSNFTIDAIAAFSLNEFSSLQYSYPISFQNGLIIYPTTAGASSGTVIKGPASAYIYICTFLFL